MVVEYVAGDRRRRSGGLAASMPNRFGPSLFQGPKQSTHRVGCVSVWSDQRKKVGEPRRRLADRRSLGGDVAQSVNEHS